MKQALRSLSLAVAATAALGVVSAGEALHLYVNSRAFDVAVAPVDAASADAESSLLYQRSSPGAEWREIGTCRRAEREDGRIRFVGEVDVEADGVYYYTSRPVVGGKVTIPPEPRDAAQAVVVVDTLAPTAEILSPAAEAMALPGEAVDLSWTVADENLGPKPAALSFSTDGGRSWTLIARDLAAEGKMKWSVPSELGGPAMLRLAAADLAGNLGRALKGLEIGRLPPERATTAPTVAETAEPAKTVAEKPSEKVRDPNRSWLYYLMAINNMRQNKPADALQYYWLSVKEDPDFVDAWADIALAYIDLGAYRTAREVAERARDKAPERIDLMHLVGETYHAEGMAKLGEARNSEDRVRAKGLVDQAVDWYGRALARASDDWRLAEQAASYYRLGEVCYYVNMDPEGARAYWKKILSLHVPTPNPDLILWSAPDEREKARLRHERDTQRKVVLDTWQGWARGYLRQLDERERAGIRDLMPAQRITAAQRAQPLAYSGNTMNPGRDDGRSLFSLPGQLGVDADVAACAGVSPAPASGNGVSLPQHLRRAPATDGYSFYATKEQPGRDDFVVTPARRGGRSTFSGGPDAPPPPNPDPYAFPLGGRERPQAQWNGTGAYGSEPIRDW